MLRIVVPIIAATAIALSCGGIAEASDTCARATGGRCAAGQTPPPPKGAPGTVTHKKAYAPSKGKGRDAYTDAQREKMMQQAREICRREFGAPSRVHSIDYLRNKVWCEPPGY